MPTRMDRFKATFSFKSTNSQRYASRKGKVVPLFTDIELKLIELSNHPQSSGEPHPRLVERNAEFDNIRTEFNRLEALSEGQPGTAWKQLYDVKIRTRNLDVLLSADVSSLLRSEGSEDSSALESVAEHRTENISKIAHDALLALNSLQARVNALPERMQGTKDRINQEITFLQFELNM